MGTRGCSLRLLRPGEDRLEANEQSADIAVEEVSRLPAGLDSFELPVVFVTEDGLLISFGTDWAQVEDPSFVPTPETKR